MGNLFKLLKNIQIRLMDDCFDAKQHHGSQHKCICGLLHGGNIRQVTPTGIHHVGL
jgi:hypothetical protein